MPRPVRGGEWMELYNKSDAPVDLSGWQLTDAADHSSVLRPLQDPFRSTSLVIPADGYMVVAQDGETMDLLGISSDRRATYEGQWCSLNNDGDRIQLRDGEGRERDVMEYQSSAVRREGYSLERIDPHRSGLDPNNWGVSKADIGHTAGRANSWSSEAVFLPFTITVQPNPFNPSAGQYARIQLTMPSSDARLTVEIFNLNSRRVRRLANNQPFIADVLALEWDGTDDHGGRLPVGRYIIYGEAIDVRRERTFQAKRTVVLAGKL